MKIRQLLVVSAFSAVAASASAFEWTPVIQQPNPSLDITQTYVLETMRFIADSGLATTDVMPKWIDENGNEISGKLSSFCDPSWGEYIYDFNLSAFKSNGEYTLLFPEGMLKNASGELSDPKEFYYTVEIPELATAMFDDFEVLSVSPDFSQPQGLWDNQLVTINTNHNDAIGLTQLFVTDNTTGESITISSNFTVGRPLGDSSEISWNVAGSFKFFEGHDYTAEFVFFNGPDERSSDGVPTPVVARYSCNFTGKVEGYKYSDVTLLSITPAPGTITISDPSQAVFTYEFSGPVNVYQALTPLGQNGNNVYPQTCLSSNEDQTVWTLDLSDDSYVKSVDAILTIAVYARDKDGYQLRGDFGEEGNSCFIGEWQCDLGAKSIVVVSPEKGASLDRLSEVVVKSESGETMTWSWVGEASIQNLLGETIGTLVYEAPAGDSAAATEFHFTKIMDESWNVVPIDIVAEGSYTIYFGPGCFVFGEEFSAVNSRSLYSGFSITGALDDNPDDPSDPQEALEYSKVYPEVGSEVESLDTVVLTFSEPVGCDDFEVNVYSVARTLVATGVGRSDYSDPNRIVVVLNEPIVEAGKYEMVIPNHVIINGDYYESDGKAGLCNPEYRLYYSVAPKGSDNPVDPEQQEVFNYTSVDPESGSTVNSLDVIRLWFPNVPVCSGFDAYLYKTDAVGSEEGIVATAFVIFDWDDDLLVNATFSQPVTEDGDYVFVIPARMIGDDDFISSDGKKGICNPEIRLNYTVGNGSGVVSVAGAVNRDVYDIQGRLVLRNASAAALKTLSKGIYVVGGKKMVVR